MNYGYQIITRELEFSRHIVNFFLSKAINPVEHQKIIEFSLSTVKNQSDSNANAFINLGYLSKGDLISYFSKNNIFKDTYNDHLIDLIIKGLVSHYLIEPLPDWKPLENISKRFIVNEPRAIMLGSNDLVFNLLCGWEYIIDKYANSVLKIENCGLDDKFGIGTGFYHSFLSQGKPNYVVITNKHVLEKFKTLKLFNKEDKEIIYEKIILNERYDLGFLILSGPLEINPLILNPSVNLLSEIITIGYPSVPMTRAAYQLVHKGEVNAFVEDYNNTDFILISAKTSSGNSGSPVLDSWGLVVGIVTEELFQKEDFYEKGKLPYYAAIPTLQISSALELL